MNKRKRRAQHGTTIFTTQESPTPSESLRCESPPQNDTHSQSTTTLPSEDDDRRTWLSSRTPVTPSTDELLTLPPHSNHWLQVELKRQLSELEKDVSALLVDSSLEITHDDSIVEVTSLSRDQRMGYTTPLYDAAVRTGHATILISTLGKVYRTHSTSLMRVDPHIFGSLYPGVHLITKRSQHPSLEALD